MTLNRPSRALLTLGSVMALLVAWGCSSSTKEAAPPPAGEPAPAPAPVTHEMPPPQSMPMTPPPMTQESPSMQELTQRQEALRQRQQEIAKHYIEMGQRYLQEGRAREARDAFANALQVQPSNADAQRLYSSTLGLLGETPPQIPEGREQWAGLQALRQQAYTVASNHLNRGHELYSRGDYEGAVESYRNALLILQNQPTLDADFNLDQVRSALAQAEQRRDQAARESEAQRMQEIAEIQRQREEVERQKAARRVQRLWEQALTAFDQERFEECEKICAEILQQDYAHPNAETLGERARRARHEKANATTIAEYRQSWQNFLEEMKSAAMPMSGPPRFPSKAEWDKKILRGPIELSRGHIQVSEADENVRRVLENTTIASVDWTDKTLSDATKFIRNNTGVNILITRPANDAIPPEEQVINNLKLDEISAMAALRLAVSQLANFEMIIEDGMVKITTKEQARKRKVVEFYEVRDLTAKLQNFPGVEINLNPSGVGAGVGGEEPADEGEPNATFEVDRLQELIRQTVDPTSWEEDADNTMVDKAGTLVVRQTPENQRRIRQLLSDLRKTAGVQVQIESRFVSVENNFLQDIGVDFRGLGDNTGGTGTPGRGQAAPFDDFGLPGAPNSVLGTDNSSGAFYNLGGGNGDIRGRTQNLFDQALGNPDVLTASGGFSLQYTYLDDTQLEAILRAVQKYERVNTVTAPNLLVYNTQRANLQVTNHVAYVKDFDVEIAQAAVIADPIVDVVKEGVILDVRPIVSNDRRFVTLELRPSVATLVRPLRTFSTTLGVGTAVTFEVPELKKESLKTTVVMPDGGTLLLGGLKFYQEMDQTSGIPILKDIPILSFFFSRNGKYTNLRDLIVLLRVKVVIMEELEPGAATN